MERFTILTPYMRYIYLYYLLPFIRTALGFILSVASFCIVWSEVIKSVNPLLSIIAVTVVHHPTSERGQIGFAGQVIAAFWILYMCIAALTSLTEVKVWRGRALVKRNTHGESAMWYAMQVAKLSVPLAFNFMTFLAPDIYGETVFYHFLGKLIKLTQLGEWFDWLFPTFILIPVCATLFNLYGNVKRCIGYGGVIDDDDEENETGYGTGSWREGRDLIERELQGHSSLSSLAQSSSDPHHIPNNPYNRAAPTVAVPSAQRRLGQASKSTSASASASRVKSQQRSTAPNTSPEDENFFEAFGHRVRNTFDAVQTPKWLQNMGDGIKKPKWMGGDGEAEPSRGGAGGRGSDFTRWFSGSREEGRVRL